MTIVEILSLQNTILRLHAITIGWSHMRPIQTERVKPKGLILLYTLLYYVSNTAL
jgi:hypothetical protein